jgi:hypothetical protein
MRAILRAGWHGQATHVPSMRHGDLGPRFIDAIRRRRVPPKDVQCDAWPARDDDREVSVLPRGSLLAWWVS